MSDWFSTLAAGSELSMDAAAELQERGFIVLPGPVPSDLVERLANAYTAAVASATADDAKIGSTSSRVSDFVNREPEFGPLYIFPPLLEACCLVIGRPFKLSSFHARTVRPRMPAQDLHVDVKRESADWPLLGFILMVDEFRPDNGATRFVPGSHRWPGTPADCISNLRAEDAEQVLACGCAGSLLVFNGSAWHGHGANTSSGRAGPSKARLFRGTGAPGPTSRPVCNPRRARDSGHSRGRCSHSDRSCLARGGSDTRVARSNNDLQPTAAGAMMRRCG